MNPANNPELSRKDHGPGSQPSETPLEGPAPGAQTSTCGNVGRKDAATGAQKDVRSTPSIALEDANTAGNSTAGI